MRKFFRFIFLLAVFFSIAYGGYYVYTSFWKSGTVEKIQGEVRGVAAEAAKETSKKAGDIIGEIKDNTVSYIRAGIGNAIGSVGESLKKFAGSIVGEEQNTSTGATMQFFEENTILQIGEDDGFIVPPPHAAVSSRVGERVLFSLNRNGTYTVDWGDGIYEPYDVGDGESKIIFHLWDKKGDFLVSIKRDDNLIAQFPVRIYDL